MASGVRQSLEHPVTEPPWDPADPSHPDEEDPVDLLFSVSEESFLPLTGVYD